MKKKKYPTKSEAIKPVVVPNTAKYSAAGRGMSKLLMGGAAAAGLGVVAGLVYGKKKKKKEGK